MYRHHLVIAATLFLTAQTAAAAAVYRCAVGGRTTYQDTPCRGASAADHVEHIDVRAVTTTDAAAPIQTAPGGAAVPAPTASPIAVRTAPATREPPARPTGEALRKARMESHVLLGMNEHDVLDVAGKYRDHEVTSGADANGEYQIWVFRQRMEGFPLTVAFRAGIVVQYSDRDLPYLAY